MTKSSFGFASPKHSPGFMLWQTTVVWQRHIKEALNPFAISHPQFVIMACLQWFAENNHVPIQADLIAMTKLDKMTVSKSLTKLVTVNYIQRKAHPVDTRAKSVTLTTKGYKLINQLIPLVEKVDREFFDVINNTEQKSLLRMFDNLVSEDS